VAPTITQLRKMTDEELVALHDEGVQNVFVGVDYYLGELARRQANRQMRMMLTLTVFIAIATLVSLLIAVFD
jgi:hypothetical protein